MRERKSWHEAERRKILMPARAWSELVGDPVGNQATTPSITCGHCVSRGRVWSPIVRLDSRWYQGTCGSGSTAVSSQGITNTPDDLTYCMTLAHGDISRLCLNVLVFTSEPAMRYLYAFCCCSATLPTRYQQAHSLLSRFVVER